MYPAATTKITMGIADTAAKTTTGRYITEVHLRTRRPESVREWLRRRGLKRQAHAGAGLCGAGGEQRTCARDTSVSHG